ncbi:MAG: ribosomal protein S18 acetylase RimI-like enzyme [Paracoccaceae bacterium]|jgi:ribosomal protein S18 acetylase RimI-like enzyme
MSAKLHLAKPEDLDRLLPLVAGFYDQSGIEQSDDARYAALRPLLDGLPHGAVYLIGPRRAPVGYLVISFGYSLELGGIYGTLDQFYIRRAVRGRGMGREALSALLRTMTQAGLVAVHLETDREERLGDKLYKPLGFTARPHARLMTRIL